MRLFVTYLYFGNRDFHGLKYEQDLNATVDEDSADAYLRDDGVVGAAELERLVGLRFFTLWQSGQAVAVDLLAAVALRAGLVSVAFAAAASVATIGSSILGIAFVIVGGNLEASYADFGVLGISDGNLDGDAIKKRWACTCNRRRTTLEGCSPM